MWKGAHLQTGDEEKKTTRRRFLKRLVYSGLGGCVVLGVYPFIEARFYSVTRVRINVPYLPAAFRGTQIALLSDIHHGPHFGIGFVESIVRDTNELRADIVALCSDYVHRDPKYIEPCIAELAKLRSRLGVFAVLGNHDFWESAPRTRAALRDAGITEVTNSGVWLERAGARLRICGVDDFWEGTQDIDAALDDCSETEAAILLSHNPDYVEDIRDQRAGLVLSGHTHGGQVDIPFIGPPVVPSRYGKKYVSGLVKTPHTQVYVSKGLGGITPPARFNCRPEIVVITL